MLAEVKETDAPVTSSSCGSQDTQEMLDTAVPGAFASEQSTCLPLKKTSDSCARHRHSKTLAVQLRGLAALSSTCITAMVGATYSHAKPWVQLGQRCTCPGNRDDTVLSLVLGSSEHPGLQPSLETM